MTVANRARYLVIACSLSIALLGGCDTFFPGGGGGRTAQLTGLDPDGGVCEKNEQTIKNVMLAPPTCNATNPCPCGTFCSSQTGGNCVADCYDDTWCAPGHYCSGYGQCLAGSADGGVDGGPSGPNVDPACPRNEALLTSLQTMRRPCEFDDVCPFGSFCNHLTGVCHAECRADSECAALNSPGHTFVCGCLGKCAEVAAPRVQPTKVLPRLEVTPSSIRFERPAVISTPDWGPDGARLVKLVAVTPFVTMSGSNISGPTATIHAKAGPGLTVRCPESSMAVTQCSVAINHAMFKKVGDVWRSPEVELVVAPSSAAPTADRWDLRLESDDIANVPIVVHMQYDGAPPSEIAPTYADATVDPAFRGRGTIVMNTPTGGRLSIPVWARWSGNYLTFYDETRQLSPSGKLAMRDDTTVDSYQFFIDTSLDNDPSLQTTLSGDVLQAIQSFTAQREIATGTIKGTFNRTIFAGPPPANPREPSEPLKEPQASTFIVESITDTAPFCANDSDCAGGLRCDSGFCSNGPQHRFHVNDWTTLTHEQLHHRGMSTWGGITAGTDHPGLGPLGIYLPSSSYLPFFPPTLAATMSLVGPIPMVSGEPRANLFSVTPSQITENVPPKAIPLLTQADSQNAPSASSLLAACLTELAYVARPSSSPFSLEHRPETYDNYRLCIDLDRVVLGLLDQATLQRMLQGWLQVHSFVAREGLEEHLLGLTANLGLPISQPSGPPLEKLLAVTEGGLGFLLDQTTSRFTALQTGVQMDVWGNVDYRRPALANKSCSTDAECNNGSTRTMACNTGSCQLLTLSEAPHHEQAVGVPPVLLETAGAYLKLLEQYLATVARKSYGQAADANPSNARTAALARFGAGMRLVLGAEQIAVGINNLAGPCPASNPNCGPCPPSNPNCPTISQRFNSARTEMEALRTRVTAQAEALRTGRNPLNIPEDDVPLFFGDVTGASSRYFAASDYLLNGWATPAVAQSQSYLDAARASWIQQLQGRVQDELNLHNREQEVSALMSKYGSPILAACGNLSVPDLRRGTRNLDSTEVIPYFTETGQLLDPNTCYLEPSCVGHEGFDGRKALQTAINSAFLDPATGMFLTAYDRPPSTLAPRMPDQSASLFARSEVCKVTSMQNSIPNETFIDIVRAVCPGDDYFTPSGSVCTGIKFPNDPNLYVGQPSGTLRLPIAAFYGPIRRADVGAGRFYPNAMTWSGTPDDNIYDFVDFRSDQRTALNPIQRVDPPSMLYRYLRDAKVWERFQGAATSCSGKPLRLVHDYPRPSSGVLPSRCYKGSLGVSFFEMNNALLRIEKAKGILATGQEGLQDTFELCKVIDEHLMAINDQIAAFNAMRDDYSFFITLTNAVGQGAATGNWLGLLTGGASLASGIMSDKVQDEALKLQQMETRFGHEEKAQECWNTFRAQRRTLATAMMDIKIAVGDMDTLSVGIKSSGDNARLNLQEGIAVFSRESASPVGSLSHHFWINERVEQYKKQFEWSRRLAFLAMRAVEFEFQQSLPFRSQIVSADTPAQLQDVMIGLAQEQAARTINRRRPEEASVVLSLRDDVLAVADRSDDPAGERNWTPAERFASRLWDTRFAMRDGDGEYLGQAIPFTLGPTGVLETRCGERLWRATATLQGDGIETSAPGASVLLLKRNSFSSQYCDGKSPPRVNGSGVAVPGPTMQVGVVHTAAQLFKPGANVDLSDANQFTAALLYPWFNVRRTDFYKTGFQDGASEELAGRGLYGDYVLLFPKQVLEDGFALEKVEDVLLRLDYLSVDNLSQ